MNFNGRSEPSDIFKFNACVAPSILSRPFLIEAKTNHITIGWEEPLKNGGCPLTGFSVYRDDGDDGSVNIEVNQDNDPAIRGNPVLRQVTVTSFEAGKEGHFFRFKVRAYNREGHIDSSYLRVLNAGRPLTPANAPILLDQTPKSISV